MTWLKRLMSKRRTKKYYLKCLNMFWRHEKIFSQTGSELELYLMEYWRNKSEEAWKSYDKL